MIEANILAPKFLQVSSQLSTTGFQASLPQSLYLRIMLKRESQTSSHKNKWAEEFHVWNEVHVRLLVCGPNKIVFVVVVSSNCQGLEIINKRKAQLVKGIFPRVWILHSIYDINLVMRCAARLIWESMKNRNLIFPFSMKAILKTRCCRPNQMFQRWSRKIIFLLPLIPTKYTTQIFPQMPYCFTVAIYIYEISFVRFTFLIVNNKHIKRGHTSAANLIFLSTGWLLLWMSLPTQLKERNS